MTSDLEQIAEEMELADTGSPMIETWAARIRAWIAANGSTPTLILLRRRTQELGELKAWIAANKESPIAGDHPEASCELCGGPNIVWFVASEKWNSIGAPERIWCPICFVKQYEKRHGVGMAWELSLESPQRKALLGEAIRQIDEWRALVAHNPAGVTESPMYHERADIISRCLHGAVEAERREGMPR